MTSYLLFTQGAVGMSVNSGKQHQCCFCMHALRLQVHCFPTAVLPYSLTHGLRFFHCFVLLSFFSLGRCVALSHTIVKKNKKTFCLSSSDTSAPASHISSDQYNLILNLNHSLSFLDHSSSNVTFCP